MKLLVAILAFALSTSALGQSQAKLKEQIAALKATQKQEYDTVLKDLKGSRDYAAGLWTDLEKAQAQVNEVGKERDGWRDYGNDQHDKLMNAELRVAKKQATILKLGITISLMSLAIGGYLIAKFYFRLPI